MAHYKNKGIHNYTATESSNIELGQGGVVWLNGDDENIIDLGDLGLTAIRIYALENTIITLSDLGHNYVDSGGGHLTNLSITLLAGQSMSGIFTGQVTTINGDILLYLA